MVNELAEEVIGVGELSRRLKLALEGALGRQWVEGEVSSVTKAASGHLYFTLRDERVDASIDCVMYRFQNARSRTQLVNGARVQLLGRATIWTPRGRMQWIAEAARPAGHGLRLVALERLKAKLTEEGLFDPDRKRPMPKAPRIVGVVTSRAGAALHDIRTVAFRRGGVRLILSSALVQGQDAASSLIAALDLIEKYPGLELIIFGRGGGSSEDLMAFNDEAVVRRVARASVPLVSAVGHEVDISLCDWAADLRAATPSQAAELVIPDRQAQQEALLHWLARLGRAMRGEVLLRRGDLSALRARLRDPRFDVLEKQQRLDELWFKLHRCRDRQVGRNEQRLSELRQRLMLRHPRVTLAQAHGRLQPLAARLGAARTRWLSRNSNRLKHAVVRLDGLSPLSVLGRGYCIVSKIVPTTGRPVASDGAVIRSAADILVGASLALRFHHGYATAKVLTVGSADSSDASHDMQSVNGDKPGTR